MKKNLTMTTLAFLLMLNLHGQHGINFPNDTVHIGTVKNPYLMLNVGGGVQIQPGKTNTWGSWFVLDATPLSGGQSYGIYSLGGNSTAGGTWGTGNGKFLISGQHNNVLVLDSLGYFGIGTVDPSARLQVSNGDIYIDNINRGIIMKSPNGQCWRGTLDNTGVLGFSQINCPAADTILTSIERKYNNLVLLKFILIQMKI